MVSGMRQVRQQLQTKYVRGTSKGTCPDVPCKCIFFPMQLTRRHSAPSCAWQHTALTAVGCRQQHGARRHLDIRAKATRRRDWTDL